MQQQGGDRLLSSERSPLLSAGGVYDVYEIDKNLSESGGGGMLMPHHYHDTLKEAAPKSSTRKKKSRRRKKVRKRAR